MPRVPTRPRFGIVRGVPVMKIKLLFEGAVKDILEVPFHVGYGLVTGGFARQATDDEVRKDAEAKAAATETFKTKETR